MIVLTLISLWDSSAGFIELAKENHHKSQSDSNHNSKEDSVDPEYFLSFSII